MPGKYDRIKLNREQDRRAKLSDAQVKKVFELHKKGYTQKAIGEIFGVRQSTICFIVNDAARLNLREHRRRKPIKTRTREEMNVYMRGLRAYKKSLFETIEEGGGE